VTGLASSRSRLRRITVAVVVIACATTALAAVAASAALPPHYGLDLYGVACPSDTSCVAAGVILQDDDSVRPVVAQWNGSTWSLALAPVPDNAPRGSGGGLRGAGCATPTQCFAVGSYTIDQRTRTLIERWDGTRWSLVSRLAPDGAKGSSLVSTSCGSPTSCMAVGTAGFDTTGRQTLAARWDGTRWSIVPTPVRKGAVVNRLNAVSCVAATNCFAVGVFTKRRPGGPLIEHWDGKSWSIVASPSVPDAGLGGISCLSATNCYAVGSTGADSTHRENATLIEHWNGTNWSIVKSANPKPGAYFINLLGVSCAAANSCFAVGGFYTTRDRSALFLHWNGGQWTLVHSTYRGSRDILGVACRSRTSCFAVGDRPLVSRWDGTQWALDPTATD